MSKNIFLIISGPSCAGKSPLASEVKKSLANLAFASPVLFHSRAMRPEEEEGINYHFRSKKDILKLKDKERYKVFEVRNELQAIDLIELENILKSGNVLYEGNEEIALFLKDYNWEFHVSTLDVFLSPLSLSEVSTLKEQESFAESLIELMRQRLLRRTNGSKAQLSLNDLEDIETRCGTAYQEMREAHKFSYVLPNHDGEDSDNWQVFTECIGDARLAVKAVTDLVQGTENPRLERWPDDLLP